MKEKLLMLIAEIIGVEVDDIEDTDNLRDDLHMSATDLAELSDEIDKKGWDHIDLSEINTVEELLDSLGLEE